MRRENIEVQNCSIWREAVLMLELDPKIVKINMCINLTQDWRPQNWRPVVNAEVVNIYSYPEEISSNSLVWHYYLWPKTPQNSTVVFVMCKNITFFACLGLGLAHMQGFRFRIGTLPLWSRILPTNEKLFKKFENGKFMSWIKNWIGSFPKYWYNDLSFGIWIGLART